MDKNDFIKWLDSKINKLLIDIPEKFIENKETKAYLKASITIMEEIKNQVESGKFDN